MNVLKQYTNSMNFNKISTRFRMIMCIAVLLIGFDMFSNLRFLNYLFGEEGASYFSDFNNTSATTDSLKLPTHEVQVSEIYPNCGIRYQCPEHTFPVHIYTGQDKDDQPKLCVGGRYVSGVGRGLNIAIIETIRLQLVSLENFDLYSYNSSTLEVWLENEVRDCDIIIAFTFDEASKELRNRAKALLYNLGSGKIQDLRFRSQWYMISQKGIQGFTPLENITYAKNDQWGEVIDERLCVPKKIPPMAVSPNPILRKNFLREKLCKESQELQCEDFCNQLARHEPIVPSLLTNRTLIGNVVFSTPVVVIAGRSLASLVLTLETLVYQPGIHPASVVIIHSERQIHVPTLARIFGFRSVSLNVTVPVSHSEKIGVGLQFASEHFPKKKYVIVLEAGLILSPDFLYYMAQLAPVLDKDDSLLGISAWNPYGYEMTSGNPHLAYRVENFPGLGFMIPIKLYQDNMEGKMQTCCNRTAIFGWDNILRANKGSHIIIPDVSRVLKRPKDIHEGDCADDSSMFLNKRVTNVDHSAWIERPHDLVQHRYFQQMANLIQSSLTFYLTKDDLNLCANKSNIALTTMLHALKHKVFTVYFHEKNCRSFEQLKAHMKCFGLFIPHEMKPQNMYEKVLRLTVNTNTVFLIDSSSPFAKNKARLQKM